MSDAAYEEAAERYTYWLPDGPFDENYSELDASWQNDMSEMQRKAFVHGAEWERSRRKVETSISPTGATTLHLPQPHPAEEALRKAQDKLDAIEQLWNISGHFEHDELYDKMMELLMGTDITCSYGPVLYEIREVLSNAPECDKYSDDDTISCGWKKDMIQVRRILDESGL